MNTESLPLYQAFPINSLLPVEPTERKESEICAFFHFYFSFSINSNKPTADCLSQSTVGLCYPPILFVAPFCGSKQSFQKPPTYNPQDFPLLAVFQQIKHLKDNSSRQNPLVIVGFLGWPYYISSPALCYWCDCRRQAGRHLHPPFCAAQHQPDHWPQPPQFLWAG